MTDQKRQAYIKALLRERDFYRRANDRERVAGVDAELTRMGAIGSAPVKRASKRSN